MGVLKYALEAKEMNLTLKDMSFGNRACGTNRHFVAEAEAKLANKVEILQNLNNYRALAAIPGGRLELHKITRSNEGLGSMIFPRKDSKGSVFNSEGTELTSVDEMKSWAYRSPNFDGRKFKNAGPLMSKLYQDPRHDAYGIFGLMQVLRNYLRADLFILFVLIIVFWGQSIYEDILLKMLYEKHKNLHSALYSLGVKPIAYLTHWVLSGAALHASFILTVALTMFA